MRKSFATLLLLAGATAILANLAFAATDGDEFPGKLLNAQMAKELRSRVAQTGASALSSDTTYVGYNSAFAGSNYWSIGIGGNEPVAGSNTARQGYWDFDHPVHGDSLQGWWPIKHIYTGTGGLTIPDDLRPWWGLDIGNECNYVINQGTANKRTFGVTGVWHADPGNVAITSSIAGTNPVPPTWATIGTLGAAAKSAWCGLRAHGDLTVQDPVTKNYYNVATLEQVANNSTGPTGTDRKFPGYAGQWDQMLYRDITIPTSGTLTVRFKYRSNMSTAVNLNNITRTGWYDQDPLTVAAGNYIKSSGNPTPPIDSFMVYVGRKVEPVAGVDNDWTGSDGLDHDVYDAQRRWFGEVVHAQDGTHHELFATSGDHATTTQTGTANLATLNAQGYGGNARLVFRVKTNRGAGSDDQLGSLAAAGYNSGGAGAVVLDDVEIDKGSGFTTLGDFEGTNGGIDNDTSVSAALAWKSTGKPPAIFYHLHDLGDLVYQDLCGQPGSEFRICNMWDGVLSGGDHDFSERVGGEFGTPEQERMDGVFSPTINLVTNGITGSLVANNMGITFDMMDVTEDYYITYDMYTGVFDLFTQGDGWQFTFQSYPATQSDGVKCWGEYRTTGFQIFNPDKQCFFDWEGAYGNGLIRTSNGSGYPDSLRIGLRKLQQCYRFGISANCSQTLGAYWDNISLMMVDGLAAPLVAVDIWQLYQDTFPANEDSGLPGLAAFDSCAALVKTGLNNAQTTGNLNRLDIPGDSVAVVADGNNVTTHLVFRINPGPGNYVTVGDKSSGLRKVPTSATAITSGDGSFWAAYINNNGDSGFPSAGGANKHGASGTFATRWNPLAWNAARMDTADAFAHPVAARNFNTTPTTGIYITTYHESDPHGGHLQPLAVMKNICFVNDTSASLQNITCGRSNEPAWPPAWVTSVPNSRTGIPVSNQSDENTKILPDGLFTPGTHVEYFFRREDGGANPVAVVPDTNIVFPQANEGSTDAHRWQEFSVLPDTWKKIPFGGPGLACMLYVDWNDRRGNERVWVSIADSIGATTVGKWGAHNGWHAAGGGADVNDPIYFVRNKNEQPGSTWDMFGVKASESLNTGAGSIGARLAHRESSPAARAFGKDAKNAPTLAMLEAYYRILLITTGDLNSSIFGPFNDKSSDDETMIESWLLGASSGSHRGIWLMGDGAVESLEGDPWLNNLSVSLFNKSYAIASGNPLFCVDLVTHSPITTNGDIYGVRSSCTFTNDVLGVEAGGVNAAEYTETGGGPYVATVFHDAISPNFWQSLVDGYDIEHLRSRFCDQSVGRLAYFYNAFTNIYAKIWAIAGNPLITLDAPGDNGKLFVDSISLANNPLRSGNLKIDLSFAKSERASVKVFDVSGRLVRTLADGQLFKAGPKSITWDAVDNGGRQVARGVYFVRVFGGPNTAAKAVVVK